LLFHQQILPDIAIAVGGMDAAIGQGRYEQKQSTALFAAQDPCQTKDFCYFSSLKSKTSPTQIN